MVQMFDKCEHRLTRKQENSYVGSSDGSDSELNEDRLINSVTKE